MAYLAQALERRRGPNHFGARLTAGSLALGAFLLAGIPIAYILWPQPAPPTLDAPSLPITVGSVTFNVPPASMRVPIQRRPGTQGRIDLVFLWPSLTPPDPAHKPTPATAPQVIDRVFVSIAASDGALPPAERLKVVYPRYFAPGTPAGPTGLTARNFRAGTPYQGEDVMYDATAPERFLLRCTGQVGVTPGMCLHERRIGTADMTVRFPRDWLADWRAVANGIDQLVASLRPSGA
jgi:hypothetical protein